MPVILVHGGMPTVFTRRGRDAREMIYVHRRLPPEECDPWVVDAHSRKGEESAGLLAVVLGVGRAIACTGRVSFMPSANP